MGVSFQNPRGKNLYDFWKQSITDNLNSILEQYPSPVIVNCAAIEYFSAIDLSKLKGSILSIVFKEYRNGELKFISFNAKKARGLMTQYIIKNKIDNHTDIKDFNYEDYKLDSKLSEDSTFVFTRLRCRMSYISFFKNQFIPTDEVNLNFLDNFLSIVRGYQVFTFFKTVDGGKPLFLDHHIERLLKNTEAMCMKVEQSHDDIKQLVFDTIAENNPSTNELSVMIVF